MTIQQVKEYLAACGLGDRVREFDVSSATVELAAQALGCEPCLIAKTMSFLVDEHVALVVLAALPLLAAVFGMVYLAVHRLSGGRETAEFFLLLRQRNGRKE